jgi:ABC-type phosphate transport system auxiliary subunit
MTGWSRKDRMIFAALAGLAVLMAGLGIFLPDLRAEWMLKPRGARAETVVMQLAAQETRMRRQKGSYMAFTAPQAAQHARSMGLDMQNWPAEDFLFDASLMPDKSLRLRALPRADSVRDLKVSGKMYVAELAPAGGINRSGWYP